VESPSTSLVFVSCLRDPNLPLREFERLPSPAVPALGAEALSAFSAKEMPPVLNHLWAGSLCVEYCVSFLTHPPST